MCFVQGQEVFPLVMQQRTEPLEFFYTIYIRIRSIIYLVISSLSGEFDKVEGEQAINGC